MSIEERFDQLLMDVVKYWKVNGYHIDGFNDNNKIRSRVILNYTQDGKKQTFFLNHTDIWSVLQTEYSLEYKQIIEFTSSRLEQAYNFMDITTNSG